MQKTLRISKVAVFRCLSMARFVNTDKRSSLCRLYCSSCYQSRVIEAQILTRKQKKTNRDFVTCWFRDLAMPLAHAGGLNSFHIDKKGRLTFIKTKNTFIAGI